MSNQWLNVINISKYKEYMVNVPGELYQGTWYTLVVLNEVLKDFVLNVTPDVTGAEYDWTHPYTVPLYSRASWKVVVTLEWPETGWYYQRL